MRSEVVVLPASIWAMIPILRTCFKSIDQMVKKNNLGACPQKCKDYTEDKGGMQSVLEGEKGYESLDFTRKRILESVRQETVRRTIRAGLGLQYHRKVRFPLHPHGIRNHPPRFAFSMTNRTIELHRNHLLQQSPIQMLTMKAAAAVLWIARIACVGHMCDGYVC